MSNIGGNQQIELARENAFLLGAVEIRPSTRELIAGEKREVLEPRVMQVLVALYRRRGEVVPRDELVRLCWNGRAVSDDAINRCLTSVRKLSAAHGGFSLETVPRVGYRLLPEEAEPSLPVVMSAGAESPGEIAAPVPVEVDVPPAPPVPLARVASFLLGHWYWFAGAVLVAVLAVVALAVWPSPNREVIARPGAKLTIAVLPFTPLFNEPEAQQLGDAIALRTADRLASSAFDVVASVKSLEYRSTEMKARAAQTLHADFLIDGDIHREGGRYLAAMRLIEGRTGKVIVTGTVNCPPEDIAVLPDDVADQMSFIGVVSGGYNHPTGWNAQVMSGYFKAFYQLQGRNDPFGAYQTARETAQLAPADPVAQTLLGYMAISTVGVLPPGARQAKVAEARAAAERSIRLDPNYGDAYAVLALATPSYDWAARESYLRRGLAVLPDSQIALLVAAEGLQNAGRMRESSLVVANALKHSGSQMRTQLTRVNARLWTGQLESVRPEIAGWLRRFPHMAWYIGKMFEATAFYGDYAGAEALLNETATREVLEPDGSLYTFAAIETALRYRRTGDVKAVVAECAKMDGRSPEVKRSCFMALVVLGQMDDAFRLAEALYPDQRAPSLAERERIGLERPLAPTAYLTISLTAPLRADPRYRELVERVGLLPYWKSSGKAPDFCATEKVAVCTLLRK